MARHWAGKMEVFAAPVRGPFHHCGDAIGAIRRFASGVPDVAKRAAAGPAVCLRRVKKERTMSKQAWSRQASRQAMIRGAAAVVLAAMMLVTTGAGAYPFNDNVVAGASHQVATGVTDEGWRTNDPDPTDDGFIIIECVGFGGHAIPGANEAESALKMHSVSMPRYPLGPSKCWPREYQRT
jgi:hypothetical protein